MLVASKYEYACDQLLFSLTAALMMADRMLIHSDSRGRLFEQPLVGPGAVVKP
jgi:hypothetical protein